MPAAGKRQLKRGRHSAKQKITAQVEGYLKVNLKQQNKYMF